MLKGCETCCFDCANISNRRCRYYAPAGYEAEAEYEDEMIENIIEEERVSFREQWFEYTGEYE